MRRQHGASAPPRRPERPPAAHGAALPLYRSLQVPEKFTVSATMMVGPGLDALPQTLPAGLYIVNGGGLNILAGAATGQGVTFY